MEDFEVQQKTFKAEMLPHMKALYYFALGKTGDPEDAKDLLQETYFNAYRYLDKYSSGTNAKGWLVRIMMNSFINRYRKSSREPDKVSYDDIKDYYLILSEPAGDAHQTQDEIFDNQLGDETSQALQNLPNDYRTVIILSDLEGYSYEEIADFVEIPIGTVRSRLHRGRKILRSALKDYASNHGYRVGDRNREGKANAAK